MNFDFKNRCKNEFKDNNEKSCSSSRNRVSHKIDLKAFQSRNGHAASVGVKVILFLDETPKAFYKAEFDGGFGV